MKRSLTVINNNKLRAVCSLLFAIFLLILTGCIETNDDRPRPTFEIYGNSHSSAPAITDSAIRSTANVKYPQWLPPASLEGTRKWEGIIVHHSASDYGDAVTFDKWHRQKGWDELGYHFVIDNGISTLAKRDGQIEVGSRWKKQKHGAHCRVDVNDDNHWNEHYIGICLVGNFENSKPTEMQYKSLRQLLEFLQERYNIPDSKVMGHRDADHGTLCPGKNFSWEKAGITRK